MTSGALVGGAVAAALLAIGAVALHRTDGGDAWSYVLFACAGLLPLPVLAAGESLLRIEGPRGIQLLVLLYAASLATGLGLSLLTERAGKNRGAFVAKGVAVSLAVLLLASGGVLAVLFSGLSGHSTFVYVKKVQPPSQLEHTELSPEDLEEYPSLKAAKRKGETEAGPDEIFRLMDRVNGYEVAEINGSFYRIGLRSHLRMTNAEPPPKADVKQVSKTELPEVSGLERAMEPLEMAGRDTERRGETTSNLAIESREDYDRISGFLGGGSAVVKVDGAYIDFSLKTGKVRLEEIVYPPKNATTLTDEELDEYPAIRRGIAKADAQGSGSIGLPRGQWKRLRRTIGGPVGYRNRYYEISYPIT